MNKIKRTSRTKRILLGVLIGTFAAVCITPALGYWVISSQNAYKDNTSLLNSAFQTSDEDYYTVDVYRAFAEPGDYVYGATTEVTVSDEAGWNTLEDLISTYNIGISRYDDPSNKNSGTFSYYNYYTYSTGTYYSEEKFNDDDESAVYACVLEITTDVVHTYYHGAFNFNSSDSYEGVYKTTFGVLTLGDPFIDEDDENEGYFGSLKVEHDGIITSKMFNNFFSSMEENYYFSNFIYQEVIPNDDDNDTGESPSFETPFYLNETKVETNLNLYVLFYKAAPIDMGLSSLTDEINNNTGTLKVSTGSVSYNICNDVAYEETSNTVSLGYYDRETTVGSGTTVNLCLADGSIYEVREYASSGSVQYINENHSSEKVCDYTVKLAGDLDIYGEFTVGADLGSGTNVGVQSNINTNYVKLDLAGHTINVYNGGSLLGYGVITDSIGNGEIHVFGGGYIETTIVMYDYKGGSSTIGSFAFDVFPFSNYNLPYLEVPTFIEYDNNGWGALKCFYTMCPFSSTVTEIDGHLNLIGTEDDTLFVLSKTGVSANTSYVLITPAINPNVTSSTAGSNYSYISSQALDRHINFYFYNVDVALEYFTLSFSFSVLGIGSGTEISMATRQFDFPISSFFSVYYYNSDFTVKSRIVFQKGSSLYMDEHSNLIFDYQTFDRTYINNSSEQKESITIAGSIFFMDVHVDSYFNNNGTDSMLATDRHNYGINGTFETYFNSITGFWKYTTSSYRVGGSILFTEGNKESYPYSIAGYCDVGGVGIINSEGSIVSGSTYSLHTTDTSTYNGFNNLDYFMSSEQSNSNPSVYYKTYDFDGINGLYGRSSDLAFSADSCDGYNALQRGRALPLISNGVAYSWSNVFNDSDNDRYSPNVVGTYDKDLNLLTDSNSASTYYYNSSDVDDKPYTGTSSTVSNAWSGYYRNREYNHTTRLKQCTYDENNHYITDTEESSDDGGTSTYIFFSSCYLPYNTTDNTVNLQRLLSGKTSSGDIDLDLSVTYSDTYSRWIRS